MFQSSLFNSIVSKYGQYLLTGLFLLVFSLVLVGRAGVLSEMLKSGPSLALADDSCSEDKTYCDNGVTIHQSGGYLDSETNECVYDFARLEDQPCGDTPAQQDPAPAPEPEPAPQPAPVNEDPVEVSPGTPADPACKQPGSCQGNVPDKPVESCTPNWQFERNECIRCGYSQSVVKSSCTGELKPSGEQRDTACDNYACPATQPAPVTPACNDYAEYCDSAKGQIYVKQGGKYEPSNSLANPSGCVYAFVPTGTPCGTATQTCPTANPKVGTRETRCSGGQRCFVNKFIGNDANCTPGEGAEWCQADASCAASNPAPAAPAAPAPAAAAPTAICMVCDNNGQTWRQAGSANMTAAACSTNSNSQWNNTTRPAWCQPAVVNSIPQGTTATCNGQSGVITLGNGSFLNCNINNNTNDNRSSASAQGGSVTNVGNNNGATNVGNNNGATLTNVGNNQGDSGSTTSPIVVVTTSQTQDFSCPANTEKRVNGNTVMCLPLCRAGELRNVNGSSVICTTPGTAQQVVTVVQAAANPQKVAQVQVAADQLPKTGLPLAAWLLVGVAPLGAKMRRFGRSSKDEITPNLLWEERQFKKV